MRTLLRFAVPCVAGLLFASNALAQDAKTGQNARGNRSAIDTKSVRGVIAGVTEEGELAIDGRTHRAVQAEATFLTVIGSPTLDGKISAPDHEDANAPSVDKTRRHRHNIYVLWLSPRTKVLDDTRAESKGKGGAASSLDALEVGDHVEIAYTNREMSEGGAKPTNARPAKHGRHRTHFGDATRITILSAPTPEPPNSEFPKQRPGGSN